MSTKQIINRKPRKHNPWITGVISFFIPGWGLCWIGRYIEGIFHFMVFATCLFFMFVFPVWFAATIRSILVVPLAAGNMLFWITPTLLFMFYTAFYTAFRTKEDNHRLDYDKYIDRRKLLREVIWGNKRIYKKEE